MGSGSSSVKPTFTEHLLCPGTALILYRQEKGIRFISRNPPSNGEAAGTGESWGAVRRRALDFKSMCYLQCILNIYNSTIKRQASFKAGKDLNRHVSKDLHVAHEHVDRDPTRPVLRETHIRTTGDSTSQPPGWPERKDSVAGAGEDMGKAAPMQCWWEPRMASCRGEQNNGGTRPNTESPWDPAIPITPPRSL